MRRIKPSAVWFVAFSAVFALAAGWLFWGTWSLDIAPVMPDDAIVHPTSYVALVRGKLAEFFNTGKFIPSDLLWKGLLVSPYFCQELKYAFALYFSGLGLAYFLLGRGLSRPAAYGAGLLLAFCGYWATLFSAGHGGWFIWMTYGVFAFGLVDRAVRKGKMRHWLLLGACVAWASFYQPDLWFMFAMFTAIYFVWCCVRERKLPWKGAIVAIVTFAVVGAPSIKGGIGDKAGRDETIAKATDSGSSLTGGKEGKNDERMARWIYVTNWSLPSDEIGEFFIPRLNGDTSCPLALSIGWRQGKDIKPYTGAIGRPYKAKDGNYRQHSVYVGWVTCLLALFGCVMGVATLRSKARADRDVVFFAIAAVLFCLLSLGRYCEPIYRLLFMLPIGDTIRCPVKWHHLTELCLCVLSAYGIEGLIGIGEKRRIGWLRFLAIAAVLVGVFDLVRQDRVFCVPVDVSRARSMNASANIAVLRKQDFSNPQLAEKVRRGEVVSLANYLGNPEYYLVHMLTPPKKPYKPAPLPPASVAFWLGVCSIVGSIFVIGYAVWKEMAMAGKRRRAI